MQDGIRDRLVTCFETVFPDLSRVEIESATHQKLGAWDSIAQVTLLSLIGEEFNFDVDFEEFGDANSFAAIEVLVREKAT